MQHKIISLIASAILLVALSLVNVSAYGPKPNTNSRMIYHNGPIMPGTPGVYFIYYGCWTAACGNAEAEDTMNILSDFTQNFGGTPYSAINTTYPNGSGQAPSGGLLHGGNVVDGSYSHGTALTEAGLADIVSEQITNNGLPQDPGGIYVIVASADVSSVATGFCTPGKPPFHGRGEALGSDFRYIFLGNPNSCPSNFQQFVGPSGLTPNDNFPADVMAAHLAHALNTTITDPYRNAWHDRYGLENADKCMGKFGTTYLTANGARANFHYGPRDFLIQQNWLNVERHARCAMSN